MVSLCHYYVRVANVAPFNILLNMKDLRVTVKHFIIIIDINLWIFLPSCLVIHRIMIM